MGRVDYTIYKLSASLPSPGNIPAYALNSPAAG